MDSEYLQYKAADFLSRTLPRRFAYWIAVRVGDLFYCRDARGRRAVKVNIRRILEFKKMHASEETLERMARETFRNFGKCVVDFFRFGELSEETAARVVDLEHREYLDKARSIGRGVLVVTAHFGSWEIGGAVIAALGHPINVVVLPQKNRKTNALFQIRRERRGEKVIQLGRAARDTIKALRNGELVAVLADRDYGDRGMVVNFMGAEASMPRGPATLCVKTGAPVLPGFLLRRADDTFVLRFHPPIVPGQGISVGDVQSRLCAVLEREILLDPSQWFMFEEFWKEQ